MRKLIKIFLPLLSIMSFFVITGCSLQDESAASNPDPDCYGNVTRPLVTYTINANGATNVALNTKVGAFFTTEMNPKTFNPSTFILKQGKRHVPGAVTYNGLAAIFTPFRNLEPSTTYTATIMNRVRDLAGNSMAKDYVWSWTTGSESDTTIPAVIHTVNQDGATDVFINTKIIATFNKVMDASTVSASTASFMQGSTQVPGKVTYLGVSLIFTPTGNLSQYPIYRHDYYRCKRPCRQFASE